MSYDMGLRVKGEGRGAASEAGERSRGQGASEEQRGEGLFFQSQEALLYDRMYCISLYYI